MTTHTAVKGLPLCTFLEGPKEISRAIADLIEKSSVMRLAVAYIRPHWHSVFSNYAGKVQVICWLSSTNTDPYAVQEMMKARNFKVRQADSMHAKVYLAPGIGAIVGSANLSGKALSDADTGGQYEAATLVREASALRDITLWFDTMWESAGVRPILDADLERAMAAFPPPPSAQNVSASGISSNVKTPRVVPPSISHLLTMPVSPINGKPLYSAGANRDVFEVVAMRAGGATVNEILKLAKSQVALEPVTKHCREAGKRGWRWNLYINGKMASVDPNKGYLPKSFQRLPYSERIQLSNFRHANVHIDSKGRVPM